MKEFSAQKYLDSIIDQLVRQTPSPVMLTEEWVKSFHPKPGAYIFFEKKTIVYVGETKNLRKRMRQIWKSGHTFRRSIGNREYSTTEGWVRAKRGDKFCNEIEELINSHFRKRLRLAFIETIIGRKEIEDSVCAKYKPKYNQREKKKNIAP